MSTTRRFITALAIVGVLALVTLLFREHASLQVLVRHEAALRQSISENAVQAWFIGLGIYFLASLVPGTGGKSVIFGWLFGMWQGVLMVDIALTMAALVTFLIGRHLIQDVIESRFATHVARLNRHLQSDGPFYLLLLRMAHAPFTFVNYTAGALQVPIRTFWWTTHLGILPGTAVFVFAGTRLPTLQELADEGVLRLLDPWLIFALVLTGILPVLIRWLVRKFHKPESDNPNKYVRNGSPIPARSASE